MVKKKCKDCGKDLEKKSKSRYPGNIVINVLKKGKLTS